MSIHGEGRDSGVARCTNSRSDATSPSVHRAAGNDASGRVLPITPEQRARNARAIADLVDMMLSMPDEDPPGAWEDAVRDLDAHRPHRRLFEGFY